jgi:hypothetical protein
MAGDGRAAHPKAILLRGSRRRRWRAGQPSGKAAVLEAASIMEFLPMRILKASVLVLGLPLALAACGSDETVTERTTTTTYPSASTSTVPSTTTASPDVVTTEREVSVED